MWYVPINTKLYQILIRTSIITKTPSGLGLAILGQKYIVYHNPCLATIYDHPFPCWYDQEYSNSII